MVGLSWKGRQVTSNVQLITVEKYLSPERREEIPGLQVNVCKLAEMRASSATSESKLVTEPNRRTGREQGTNRAKLPGSGSRATS